MGILKSYKAKPPIVVFASIGFVLLLVLVDTLLVGNLGYYKKWSSCGAKPVRLTSPVSIGFGATQPTAKIKTDLGLFDEKVPVFRPVGEPRLYCTAEEARAVVPAGTQVVVE